MAILTHHHTPIRPLDTDGRNLPARTWMTWQPMSMVRWAGLLVMLGYLCSPIPPQAMAQDFNGEYSLKAAFLYNFAKFAEWPAASFTDNRAPFVICAVGDDSFGPHLDNLAGKVLKDRPLVTKRLHADGNLIGCHILYISPGQLNQTRNILQTLQKSPVLTVCDAESCAETGIMLNLRMVENRITLELNPEAVQQTPLKLSSQLMKLTRIVKGQP